LPEMSSKKIPMLSKSKYLAGLQCPLRLWYQCYSPELATPASPAQQALFDTGHQVGELATHLYPGGVLVETDPLRHDQAVRETIKAMEDPLMQAVFEASFVYDEVRVKVDILARNRSKWNLVEVKSSTKVKNEYLPDVAVQYHVLKGAGTEVDRLLLQYLDNQYVYDGQELDLERLFIASDLTEQAHACQEEIQRQLLEFKDLLERENPPVVAPSRHCLHPYACEFRDHCSNAIAEHPVWELSGISQVKLNQLAAMNIRDIRDVPSSFALSEIQERIRTCVRRNEEYTDRNLKSELLNVVYPVHFLDFETLGPAIPRYAGTRPYQTIPFQWSDHILYTDGSIDHRAYLCPEDKDPRAEFTSTLLDVLGEKGSICTYTNYEKGIIEEMAGKFPAAREKLLKSLDRLVDLYAIIRKHYYHPDFHGSFSIKSVLPALLPDMGYDKLAVQDGQEAGAWYMRMIDASISPEERERIRRDLLAYCEQDTLAMVRIREDLLRRMG
jgi:predicted RecB family nuclease